MNIRPYLAADEAQVIALWQTCGLTRPWNNPILDIQRKLRVQPDWFLVGEDVTGVMASAMFGYDGHRGWINYLAVAPDFQRRGLARQLVEHGESLLLAAGCPKLNLLVRSSNASVIGFYKKLGYGQDEVLGMGKRLIPDTPI